MTPEEMWQLYRETDPRAGCYEAWAFCGGGEIGDQLARLVLAGTKTATASAYSVYVAEEAELPETDTTSVVLWSDGQAACVIRDTKVELKRFREVGADQAWNEGEGDRSLSYWRRVHEEVFTEEFAALGLVFFKNSLVVCETFELVYPCSSKKGEG